MIHDALEVKDSGKDSGSTNPCPRNLETMSCASSVAPCNKVALPVVSVLVKGSGSHDVPQKTYALLDPGSNKSFCSRSLSESLNVTGTNTNLSLSTLNEASVSETVEVSLDVTSATGKTRNKQVIQIPKVYALPSFPDLVESYGDSG